MRLLLVSALSVPLVAQQPSESTVAPRRYWAQAMVARTGDSLPRLRQQWRRWSDSVPNDAAPRFGLAMVARVEQRYDAARAWLDSAQRVATTPLWRSAIARERAVILLSQGELTDVRAAIAAALADSAAVPRSELAETRYVEFAVRRRLDGGNTLAPMAFLDSIDALIEPTDTLMRARIGCSRALFDARNRDSLARAAMSLAKAAQMPYATASCALAVGTLYANAGNRRALGWFTEAEALARSARDETTLAAALQWHGYTLVTYGAMLSARRLLVEAIITSQRIGDRNVEAWAQMGMANSTRQIGDYIAANMALTRAASLFDATGDQLGAWNARLERGVGLITLGDVAGAERVARDAAAYATSIRSGSLRIRALNLLSDAMVRTGRHTEAAAVLDTTEQLVRAEAPGLQTQMLHYRAVLATRQRRNADATRIIAQVLDSMSRTQHLFRYSTLATRAVAALQDRDTARAQGALLEANAALDALRDAYLSSAERRVVSTPDSWGGTMADADIVLAALTQSPRWLPTAFAVAERTRSRALSKGGFGIDSGAITADDRRAAQRVRASATELRDVQRQLKPNTALLIYAGGAGAAPTSVMVVTRTTARGFNIAPIDSLDRVIVRWLALMESGESGAGAGRQVSSAVLGTAIRALPAAITKLIVVPQGALFRVPFHALPIGSGVLGNRAIVTVSPSVSLAMSYAAESRVVPASVLAFGAGDASVESATPPSLEIGVERGARSNPLVPLLAAGDEARAAANWGVGSVAYTGTSASESAFKLATRGSHTILHAAAHALTSDQALGANWLILRPDSLEDGYVSGGELGGLSQGMSLVVLSGCRTTGNFTSRGDAIDGLVAPLLARGVHTVVASHWAVSDRWTRVLMERFYQQLARGRPVAEAMQVAQMSLRSAGVPARFWAAFSVIGDGALTFTSAAASR